MSDALTKYGNNIMASSGAGLKLSNLSPENIKKDVNIGGIVGTFEGEETSYYAEQNITELYVYTLTITGLKSNPKQLLITTDFTGNSTALSSIFKRTYTGTTEKWTLTYYNSCIFNVTNDSQFHITPTYSNGTLTIVSDGTSAKMFRGKITISAIY